MIDFQPWIDQWQEYQGCDPDPDWVYARETNGPIIDLPIREALIAARGHVPRQRGGKAWGSIWWVFEGSDVPHFYAYTRWNMDRITMANFAARQQRSGLLVPLCKALEQSGYDVRFETVHNPYLARSLLKRGYAPDNASDPQGANYDWVKPGP